MAQRRRADIDERDLVGFKYFKKILRMLDRLHDAGCGRDRAHNRQLHFDQYAALMLLYFFNPENKGDILVFQKSRMSPFPDLTFVRHACAHSPKTPERPPQRAQSDQAGSATRSRRTKGTGEQRGGEQRGGEQRGGEQRGHSGFSEK